MNVEFTIKEIEEMLVETNATRKENLRLQSLTTDEFLLNLLSDHYRELLNDLAELKLMQENSPDFLNSVW